MGATATRRRWIVGLALAVFLLPVAATSAAGPKRSPIQLEFLGEVVVPTGTTFAGTEIGGLSSITYDRRHDVFHVLSDDQGNRDTGDPVRYYTLRLDVADGSLDDGDVHFTEVTALADSDGDPFAPGGLDPEGFTLAGPGSFYVSSEGNIFADPIIDPFIRRYRADGTVAAELPIPGYYTPNGVDAGVRFNLAFESLNLTPDGRRLVTAAEGPLFQDGPPSSFEAGSLARILLYDARHEKPVAEYVYEVGPWAEPSAIFGVNGIVEVLPLDNRGRMLVMERSFSVGGVLGGGTGNVVVINEVSLTGATDVLGTDALYDDGAPIDLRRVRQREVFAFDDLGIPIDNLEGMTFGPRLPDGRRSIVVVSDNNFGAGQFTQFILLALDQVGPKSP